MISIIIPCLNSEITISNALKSIAEQSNKDYEVIIVDGKSEDKTLKIINNFKHKLSSLTIISQKDDGIYHAMNKGILRSKGKWLTIIGSDDHFFEDIVFEKLFKVIKSNKLDKEVIVLNSFIDNRVYINNFSWRLIFNNTINHQGLVYPAEYLKKNNFNQSYKYAADYELNLKLYLDKNIKKFKSHITFCNYSTDGLSSRNYNLGQKEISIIRLKTFGLFGHFINILILIRNFFRR